MRVLIRIVRFVLHVGKGLLTEAWLSYRYGADWYTVEKGRSIIRRWMVQLCNILDMEVILRGKISEGTATLFVANHISWLDIIGINSVIDARFIAKSNVKSWPVLGALAATAGTMFITRDNRSALRQAIATIQSALSLGSNVVIFPEGTTTTGDGIEPFHNGLFQVAVESSCPVQAVTLRYRRRDEHDEFAAFVGQDTFVSHLLRILSRKGLKLELQFGEIHLPPFTDRRQLASDVRETISSQLNGPDKYFSLEQEESYRDIPIPIPK